MSSLVQFYITHITYITHFIYITHIVKLTFKAYQKTVKIFFHIFFLYIKMLNNYYQKYKEKLGKEACGRYKKLSVKEKDKENQYARERYKNLTEEEKGEKRQYGRQRYSNVLEGDSKI